MDGLYGESSRFLGAQLDNLQRIRNLQVSVSSHQRKPDKYYVRQEPDVVWGFQCDLIHPIIWSLGQLRILWIMAQQPLGKPTARQYPREILEWKGSFEPLLKQLLGIPPSLVADVDDGDYEETHALIER